MDHCGLDCWGSLNRACQMICLLQLLGYIWPTVASSRLCDLALCHHGARLVSGSLLAGGGGQGTAMFHQSGLFEKSLRILAIVYLLSQILGLNLCTSER